MTRRGFTLTEMATTVAGLVIVLGLMVSLARYVRYRSANELTRDLLGKLDEAMVAYERRYGDQWPPVTPLLAGASADEASLAEPALKNNEQWVRALRAQSGGAVFRDLPISMYDEAHLRDAWGQPIVLLPHQHPLIGMAPRDRAFFFSAGPDRRYLTRDDNLYSYEAGRTR